MTKSHRLRTATTPRLPTAIQKGMQESSRKAGELIKQVIDYQKKYPLPTRE